MRATWLPASGSGMARFSAMSALNMHCSQAWMSPTVVVLHRQVSSVHAAIALFAALHWGLHWMRGIEGGRSNGEVEADRATHCALEPAVRDIQELGRRHVRDSAGVDSDLEGKD